eukprot:1464867-Pleurochrysis_carterae.AAC.5
MEFSMKTSTKPLQANSRKHSCTGLFVYTRLTRSDAPTMTAINAGQNKSWYASRSKLNGAQTQVHGHAACADSTRSRVRLPLCCPLSASAQYVSGVRARRTRTGSSLACENR